MPLASHICPRCHEARDEDDFKGADGKPRKWCSTCRATYRDRLTNLHKKQENKGSTITDTWEKVAKDEGYAGHPLAKLLALAHLAGFKQRLGIQYGKRGWLG